MQLFSKEYYDLMFQFKKAFRSWGRTDKEKKELWVKGYVYEDGKMNELFLAYRKGYALGKSIYMP